MSFQAWRFAIALAAGLILASPRVAWAETDRDRAAARSAADAGADAFDQGDYGRALELFSRAEQLLHAPPHLLYMARSLVKLGRLVEAHEKYLRILNEPLPANAPKAFKSAAGEAEREIEAVEARIAYVTVTVSGRDGSQAALTIDHVDVPAAEQGIPIPVDPGTHVFSAHTAETKSNEKSVTLADGAKLSVALTLPEPASATSAAPAPVPVVPAAAPSSPKEPDRPAAGNTGSTRRIVGYTTLGVGVVGTAVGTYFLTRMLHYKHLGNQAYECNSGPSTCSDEQRQVVDHYDHESDKARNWAIGSYAVGAAGLTTGLVLLLTGGHSDSGRSLLPIRNFRVVAGIGSVTAFGRF